jgi:hypothetical protein
MGPDAGSRTTIPGYAGRPITKAPNWHGLVTLDLLFNNLSTGLFLMVAVGELATPARFAPLAPLAYPIALLFLIGDLVSLVLDLGNPSRFHHMLRIWKPSSPMSLGTWVLTAYAAPLTEALLLAGVVGQSEADGALRLALELLLPLNLVVLALLVGNLRGALVQARAPRMLAVIGTLVVLGGILVPFGLLAHGTRAATSLAVLLIVLGALVVRNEMVRLPQILGQAGRGG